MIFFHDDEHVEGRCTVVTETRGPMVGRRVVRGREAECLQHEQAATPGGGAAPDDTDRSG
ncbi:MAG: hypothetical protein R3E68_01840 [Burkholderiaceae bacterium]